MIRLTEIVFSSCSTAPSDDYFGFCRNRAGIHLWVIDGATSLSDRPCRLRPDMRDPAWFARALSAGMTRILRVSPASGGLTPRMLAPLLSELGDRYHAAAGGDLRSYEIPLAAMTYLCLRQRGDSWDVTGLQYADCFHAIMRAAPRLPMGRTGPLPQTPRAASLPKDDATMQRLRDRRTAQIEDLVSTAISLRPESAACAEPISYCHRGPGFLIVGSDGFARLHQEYGLLPREQLMRRVAAGGALASVAAMRRFENAHPGHGRSVKPADDATVMTAILSSSVAPDRPEGWKIRRNATTTHWAAIGGASLRS